MEINKPNFIIIDDSKLDRFIAEKLIKNTGKNGAITLFSYAKDAFEQIENSSYAADEKTIIIIDVQMPLMGGYEFVDAFEKLPAEIKINFSIYMITSSINETDRIRINNLEAVKQLLDKPLTGKTIAELIDAEYDKSI